VIIAKKVSRVRFHLPFQFIKNRTNNDTYHYNSSKNRSMLSQCLGEGPGIDSVDSRDVVVTQPLGKTLVCSPVGMFPGIRTDNQSSNVNVVALKKFGQIVIVSDAVIGNTVVSNQGKRQDKNLTTVGRIRQGFGVSDHARVEDNFAGHRCGSSKGTGFDGVTAIGQIKPGWVALK